MCGITGFFFDNSRKVISSPRQIGEKMIATLRHRGPDSSGVWMDQDAGILLAHARLAIIDLSPAGHQPMISASGRYVLVFNGEIYNFVEIRKELEKAGQAPEWRGNSDTEVLLAAFETWGVEHALKATVGMFALALWDRKERALYLARDRMGEKPLYYGWQQGVFMFASELKAMKEHPEFSGEIDHEAVNLFFHHAYIPAPFSVYNGIFKLLPGTFLKLSEDDHDTRSLPDPITYWSLEEVASTGCEHPFAGDFREAVDELDRLLREAVQLQSIADVPVGAFLSGGIDSSAVVAMMQNATSSQVTTFSIGMPEARMNEAHLARKVAEHLGTRHIEHVILPEEAMQIIPDLPKIWDEPFADSSQIPTHLVCRLAKQQVTVALSGDGGDEFFWGYPQYTLFKTFWKFRALRKLPLKMILRMLSPLSVSVAGSVFLRRAVTVVEAIGQTDGQALSRYWMDKFRMVTPPFTDKIRFPTGRDIPVLPDVAGAAALWDAAYYLPDDILTKVDRAAMAVSLETRAPLLDHRIVEFALSLPPNYRLKGATAKRVLRELLYKYVPKKLVDRPKMGFSIPLSAWLKKELRPWTEDILHNNAELESFGLDPKGVKKMWKEHVNGRRDHTERIWIILSLTTFPQKSL